MTTAPKLIRDLIVVSEEGGFINLPNPIKMAWDKLVTGGTDRSPIRSYSTIDGAYTVYTDQGLEFLGLEFGGDPGPRGSLEALVLKDELIKNRKKWVADERSDSLYWSTTDRQRDGHRGVQVFKAARSNLLYETGTSNFLSTEKQLNGFRFGQIIRAAELLLYDREKETRNYGHYNALQDLGLYFFNDGRTQAQALEGYVNFEVVDALLFYVWMLKKIRDVEAFKESEITKEIKTDEDYAIGLVKALDKFADGSVDPDIIAKELVDARVTVSTTKFNKQKYLLQNLHQFASHSESDPGLSRRRFLSSSDSTDATATKQKVGLTQDRVCHFLNSHKNAVNLLSGMASAKRLFDASTEELSKLVPRIRLYKVKYNEKMEYQGEVEIKFPTKTQVGGSIFDYNPNFASLVDKYNPKDFTKTRRDYGIQSFSWKYNGADPFAVDRDIEANLELYFQDFSQFTALRGLTSKEVDEGQLRTKSDILTEGSYRYLDLIVPMSTTQGGKNSSLAQKFDYGGNFHQDIRVVAGWEVPSTASESFKTAIKNSQVDFILTPMDYSLSFAGNGNGAVVISIQYRARIESVGKNRLINVIAATKTEAQEIEKFENVINDETTSAETKKDFRNRQAELYKNIRKAAAERFIEKMLNSASIYWRSVDVRGVLISTLGKTKAKEIYEILYSDRGGFEQGNTYIDGLELTLEALEKSATPVALSDLPAVSDLVEMREKDEFIRGEKIIYTFFGDIVQTAIEIACTNDSFLRAPSDVLQNLKLATLDFKFGDKTYNLSNLPIEMSVFTEFLYDSIGKKNIQTKSIISFITELLANVVTNRIDTLLHMEDGSSRSFKVGYQELSEQVLGGYLYEYDLQKTSDLRLLTEVGRTEKKRQYLIVYSDNPLPKAYKIPDTKRGYKEKKREDEKAGLLHISLGSTRSLVKNISFDKKDLEFAREHRLTINQEDPYALLTNVFNVTIDMFGNNYFKPGSYLYVDPKVLGGVGQPYKKGSIANVMGLGGYHIVTSVSHTINGNAYSTNIEALWETSGDGGDMEDKVGKEEPKEDGANKK